jgi:hypothetical protein
MTGFNPVWRLARSGFFLFVPDVIPHSSQPMTATQYGSAEAIVDKIRAVLGDFKGYRALHADGRLFCGWFQAND